MRADIQYRPSYSMVTVTLDPGESVQAEAGAMVSMSANLQVQTSAGSGGIFGGLKRSILGGESFFMNQFNAPAGGEISFAPELPGDILQMDVTPDRPLYVQSGGFLAGAMTVDVDTKWQGAKGFFSAQGLFLLKLSGSGPAWVSSYGAIHEGQLAEGERYVIDTGHIVAFESTVTYSVRPIGGIKTTVFGGEGLVAEFVGPGRIWQQTRSPGALVQWLIPQIPQRSSNS